MSACVALPLWAASPPAPWSPLSEQRSLALKPTGALCGPGTGWSSGRCGGTVPAGKPLVEAAAPKVVRIALPFGPGLTERCSGRRQIRSPTHPATPGPPSRRMGPLPPAGGQIWLPAGYRLEARIGLEIFSFSFGNGIPGKPDLASTKPASGLLFGSQNWLQNGGSGKAGGGRAEGGGEGGGRMGGEGVGWVGGRGTPSPNFASLLTRASTTDRARELLSCKANERARAHNAVCVCA